MTLFLDRDGVINRRLPGAYVRSWEEFTFLDGVLPALAALRPFFKYIVIVTNQQGIAKGLMTEDDLEGIHRRMLAAIRENGGAVSAVYHCPDAATVRPNCRKPGPAMARQAQRDFPDIDFRRSIMIGDSRSDMEFGKGLGMHTVLVSGKEDEGQWWEKPGGEGLVDELANSLAGWAAQWMGMMDEGKGNDEQ